MWLKMCLMGDTTKEGFEYDNKIMKSGMSFLLKTHGDSFIRDEYDVIKRIECSTIKQRGDLLSLWKSHGWIIIDCFFKNDGMKRDKTRNVLLG